MSVASRYLQVNRGALRGPDGNPVDGLLHPGQSYHVDIPAPDHENLVIQVLHLKLPLTHDFVEEIGNFQKKFGLDTEATAQLILSLGVMQLRKLMDSPLADES